MINKTIHINYNAPDVIPWLISLKEIGKNESSYTATPMKFEKLVAGEVDDTQEHHSSEGIYHRIDELKESVPHIRLAINAYYILKAIARIGVKKIHARYHCNPLPVMLVTLELDDGKAELTLNLYAPNGKVELTSTREIYNFDTFKKDINVEFKAVQEGIFKPVPKHFYVIDVNNLDTLSILEGHCDILARIKQLHELANEVSKEALK